MAVAQGSELAIFNVMQEGDEGSGSSKVTPMHACLVPGEITSMAWIAFNRQRPAHNNSPSILDQPFPDDIRQAK